MNTQEIIENKHPKIVYKFPYCTSVLCADGTTWTWVIRNKHVEWYCTYKPYIDYL